MNQSYSLIPLDQIEVSERLRVDLGEVEELANSIRENGLMQPLVVTDAGVTAPFRYKLVAGGRRYTALTALKNDAVEAAKAAGVTGDFVNPWASVPCVMFEKLSAHQRVKLELEENLRRKDMTWQEKCVGIAAYHELCKKAAVREGEQWTQEETGRLLGVEQSQVSNALRVAREIRAGNKAVIGAENMFAAMQVLIAARSDQVSAELMRRLQVQRAQVAAPAAPAPVLATATGQPTPENAANPPKGVGGPHRYTQQDILSMYTHGNALDMLPKLASQFTINHIITDPPYGIDMANLVGESVERIAETHDVEENLKLLPDFLDVSFKALANDGFLCMWYDLDHHEKLAEWAKKVGFRVQRWPFIWCKSSPCRNSQAQYNITKATEVCYMFRKSEQSVLKIKRQNNFLSASSASTPTHPFVKPFEVWSWLIDTVSLPNQVIVDPFAGEGSLLAAAFRKNRMPHGIEIDDKHIASGLSYIEGQINQAPAASLADFANDLAEPAF